TVPNKTGRWSAIRWISGRRTHRGFGEYLGEEGAVDVAAGLDDRDLLAGEPAALVQRGGERRRAGALGDVVRVAEDDAHRLAHLVLADGDDAGDMAADAVERR